MTAQLPVTREMHAIVYRQWVQALINNLPESMRNDISEYIRQANHSLYNRLGFPSELRVNGMSDSQLRAIINQRQADIAQLSN